MDLPAAASVVGQRLRLHWPHGPTRRTSIIDVRDPKNLKVVAHLDIPEGLHSHKVRVSGAVMLVTTSVISQTRTSVRAQNFRYFGQDQTARIVFTNSGERRAPIHLERALRLHLAHCRGLQGNIAMMLDMKNPEKPRVLAGGCQDSGSREVKSQTLRRGHALPHPIRRGDRPISAMARGIRHR